MSEKRKANFDGLFFVTLTVVGWIDVFSRRDYAEIVIKNIAFCQRVKGLELYAYVLMTNHLHMIAADNNGQLNKLLKDFKSFTAKELIAAIQGNNRESRKDWLLHLFRFHARFDRRKEQFCFWQSTNHASFIRDVNMLRQKVDYVHQNPVRAGYVLEPEHWHFSSACERSPITVLEL
ncbi:MAG: transposase [Candidatus Pseudobacter hemicellulosilyticus]|uniref:Transposase n=1 Tax=Candidatus Pseudobacter hemicellulosilyticus TaxID=3121375 RepID=A0AAJ5WR16_9BACT|nr:MAG: transposase [Pseudobacter sp.]